MPKMGWVGFELLNSFELFSKFVRYIFLILHIKWLFWVFKENPYVAQNWVNGPFLGPKTKLFNISQHLFIKFIWINTWWQVLKIGQKWLVKENPYYAQNGVIGSSVGSGCPLLLRTCFRCTPASTLHISVTMNRIK